MSAAEKLTSTTPNATAPRKVGFLLGAGIFVFPYLFSWLTLREGHSVRSRVIAFAWLGLLMWTINSASHNSTPQNSSPTASVDRAAAKPKVPKQIDPKIFTGLNKSYDKMENLTWYKHPSYGNDVTQISHMAVYMGSKEDHYWLRLLITYSAEEWLFVQSYKFLADGRRFELRGRGETKVGGAGSVYEWLDVPVNEDEEALLRAVANAKDATVRYEGRQFYKDRKISAREKEALKKMLAVYDAVK